MNDASSPETLGATLDRIYRIDKIVGRLNKRIDRLKAERERLDTETMSVMEDAETIIAAGKVARGTITESDVPTAQDWNKIEEFIYQNRALYLLDRRISAASYRELLQSVGEIPGIATFTRKKLNVRKR